MPNHLSFDVQELISAQLEVPPEYRLRGVSQLMKVENILQSGGTSLPFPQNVPDESFAWHCAVGIQNVEELPFIAEVLQTERVEAWRATLQSDAGAGDFRDDTEPTPQSNGVRRGPCSDIRHRVLRANKASNDTQWLTHLNEYLAAYGVAPLDLIGDSSLERIFRIKTLTTIKKYHGGPLVSVIMPVFNGASHLEWAANSILDQSWSQLELIIIDDCSTDGTADVIRRLAARDERVKAACTPTNSGPYVSKNMGLTLSKGDLITGHDADDWAHPARIENQVRHLVAYGQPVSIGHMIRMKPSGLITKLDLPSSFSTDGILKKAGISAIFNADFFHSRLGSWDNVRFAADSELLGRAAKAMGHPIAFANVLTMLCLDLESSLSNRPGSAIEIGGLSGDRLEYRLAWSAWHASLNPSSTYLPLNQGRRYFDAPLAMQNERPVSSLAPAT